MNFEWDLAKELENKRKHGISFTEAVETFSDPNGVQLVDKTHSKTEERFYWVGKSDSGRILTTRFTRRGTKIRIIGCAEWRKFRRFYETAQDV
ncbi:MAG: BrnT family toxin [Bdellovibrionales bacterium]|nr:BrnT family toxin [Bdellovibrionales bacterium]